MVYLKFPIANMGFFFTDISCNYSSTISDTGICMSLACRIPGTTGLLVVEVEQVGRADMVGTLVGQVEMAVEAVRVAHTEEAVVYTALPVL